MRTVSEAMKSLLNRIQPTGGELQAADRHCETIRARLESVLTVKKFITEGSFSRNTFIRGRSDVDIFAQISLDDIRWGNGWKSSFTVLDNFRTQIAARLPYSSVALAPTKEPAFLFCRGVSKPPEQEQMGLIQ